MKCAVHTDVDASGFCRNCGKPMCPACVRQVREVLYCEDCVAQVMGVPATQPATSAGGVAPGGVPPTGYPAAPAAGRPAGTNVSSNPVVAFFLGLIPGLGAIYNGEYNKGLIHILVFAAMVVALSSGLDAGPTVALSLLLAGFVVYMAIDASRTAKAKLEGRSTADPLETLSKEWPVGPSILIGAGVLFLLNNFGFFDYFRVRQLFLPLVLIGVGFIMLRNRLGGSR